MRLGTQLEVGVVRPRPLSMIHQQVLPGEIRPVISPWKATLERGITVDWMRDAYAGGG